MKAIEFYNWLDNLVKSGAFPEDADLVLLLYHLDGGFIYLNNPIIDEEGDIVLNDKD